MIPTYGHDNVLYGRGISGGNVTPQYMPPLPPRCQLEAGDIKDMEADRLQGEVPRLAVEEYNDAAMRSRGPPLLRTNTHSTPLRKPSP